MDSKKRIAVIGAGMTLGQHLAQSLNAENHMRQAVREIQEDARRQGFDCEMYQDEMVFSSTDHDKLDALRMALMSNGVKAHEEAERIIEEWRAGPGRALAEPWKKAMTDVERITPWVGFDLSAIEDRILCDEAHHPVRRGEFVELDFAVYKAEGRGFGYWPQFMGRAHRLQNLPVLPHRKPDRQPRGKAFRRMMQLGYKWGGKL